MLGAVREEGKFIFWDDDVDIAVPYEELDRAKRLVKEYLGDKYALQDYSEEFYSPRLSNFRVRDRKSIITEKDSYISGRYKEKGIFLDVYAYSPILIYKTIDSLYRRALIQPLHKKLADIEFKQYTYGETAKGKKYDARFYAAKECYLKRVSWYLEHARNRDYWCYTPNYLNYMKKYPYVPQDAKKKSKDCDVLKRIKRSWSKMAGRITDNIWLFRKPQPYIEADALWGKNFEKSDTKALFGIEYSAVPRLFSIPYDSKAVLTHCYGDYESSPYVPIERLYSAGKNMYLFSKSKSVTSLKHLRTVKYLNEEV